MFASMRLSIDDIDERVQLDYETDHELEFKELEADPIAEDEREGDPVHVEQKIEDVEANSIYVGRIW